jgi:uncharacterized protein
MATNARLNFGLKIVSRCNLNCNYCYMYHKGDTTWRAQPSVMPDEVFEATVARIREHCLLSGQGSVQIVFHGGEPTLAGVSRVGNWCTRIQSGLAGIARPYFAIQTNGTLIDDDWADLFLALGITVGISIDGPAEINDLARVDHAGRGSYAMILRGVETLRQHGIPAHFLCVIPLGANPMHVHRHFLEMGASSIDYLLPDHTYKTIDTVRRIFGPTPCADFLIPIFDDWVRRGHPEFDIGILSNMARIVLGSRSKVDYLGNRPFRILFVGSNGEIEGLDVLRICENGMARTGLNVLRDAFSRVAEVSSLHAETTFDGASLPTACGNCAERETCAGGYLPHRYSPERGFDNPSVWCADLLRLFAYIRRRLDCTAEETSLRRHVLHEMELESGVT